MSYAKEASGAVRDWAFRNTDYPMLYSYCKYTNEPSYRTAESIGMHFDACAAHTRDFSRELAASLYKK